MAMQLTGRVKEVRPTQTVTTKNGQQFAKRELILDCTRFDPYTGERGYENTPCITFAQDKCSLLDNITPGTVVIVNIDIMGRKSPNSEAYYNDVRGYRIEAVHRQQTQPQPIPQAIPQQPVYAPPAQWPSQQTQWGQSQPNTNVQPPF